MHADIARHRAAIMALCQRHHVARLEIFGSAARGDDFDPARSDVDVLVEFLPGRTPAWEFFRWGGELRELIGRKVDLHSKLGRGIEPYARKDLLTVYEQA